ncbi:Peptidase M76 ATP23 [Trinorchestia longiramus]|nr:Peptidase M76 ATP23 [Trinorchestia longiramus]
METSSQSKSNDEASNSDNSSNEKEQIKTTIESDEKNESGGFDLFPERKGERFSPTWSQVLLGYGKENLDRVNCEKRVLSVVEKFPLVKLMMSALEASGCPVDISRHVACEICDTTVTGGYDIENNQIVVCQNMCKMEGLVAGVLTHEMIHMFDHCKHNIDFSNIDHLACTEIRAANLTHCSFVTAVAQGDASPIRIAKAHQECVKTKAAYSVEAVKHVGIAEARRVVNKVFPHCYADLEPIGRRVRRNSVDEELAYKERRLYGY